MADKDGASRRALLAALGLGGPISLLASDAASAERAHRKPARLPRLPATKPRNIIVILTDDHRYDALGFMKSQAFLETPNLDRLAAEGVHFKNAVVTTALCSP